MNERGILERRFEFLETYFMYQEYASHKYREREAGTKHALKRMAERENV